MIQKRIIQPIKKVIDSNICTGCATCVGVCPNKALRIEVTPDCKYIPKLTNNNCKECYLCTQVCPACNENFKELNKFIFNKIPKYNLLGNYINCYLGYSVNSKIRWSTTSGGLITSLLLFLLKKRLIDGALLTRADKKKPLIAEPFIARTKKEILLAMGSKYVPVPLNQLLDKIISENGKFAVVGLPCHIQGIRRAELKVPGLQDKIAYHLGIVCSHTVSFIGVEYILNKMGISLNEVSKLKYRGDGWPSGIKILLKNGDQKYLSNQDSLWSQIFGGYFFAPYYCTLCNDDLNEYSDISFADAWINRIMKKDNKGTSIMITRTSYGEDLIKEAILNSEIKVTPLKEKDLIKSQLWPLLFKKRNIKARIRLLNIFRKTIPKTLMENSDIFLDASFWDYIAAPIPYINIFISKNKLLNQVLKYIPLKLLTFYRQKFKKMLTYHSTEIIEQSKEIVKNTGNTFKIVITNSHANNRGDEAAQRSLINSIKLLVPNAKFTVFTISPNGLQLQENVNVFQTFSASGKNALFIVIWTYFRSLGIRLPTFNKGRKIFELIEEMAKAKIIISAPGGPYFGDLYSSHEIKEHLLHIYLSKILRKPVMIYGPSMGPFNSHIRNIIRRHILNKVEIITLRDHISEKYVENLTLTRPLIYLASDSAFQDAVNIDEAKIKKILVEENIIESNGKNINKGPLIGITPTGAEWNYRNSENPEKEEKRYNKIIAKTINYLIKKFNARIVFFPQLYGDSDDMPLIKKIIKMVDKKETVKIISKEFNSDIQQAIISQMNLFIGNRYHSVIFALKGNIPTVCLAYEHKSIGVMETVKLEKYVIKINTLSYKVLIKKINQAWMEKEKIKNILKQQMNIVRRLSVLNSIFALALVNCTMRHNTQKKDLEKEIDKLMNDFQHGKLSLPYDCELYK